MTRVALYSHDALGLGHIRRSLAIARALSTLPSRPDVLVLSGAREAGALPRPDRCDIVGLPGLAKRGPDRYAARDLADLRPSEVLVLRSRIAAAALDAFSPDLLVVDRHPGGVGGELQESLRLLAGRTRIVLGLRDVVDAPELAAREWEDQGCAATLDAYFDAVWVYGDQRVHDPIRELEIPARLRDAVSYTGYLAHGRDDLTRRVTSASTVLGVVGGGSDGADLARAFVDAAAVHGRASDLVLGSQMPQLAKAEMHARAARVPRLVVHDFVADMAGLLDKASAVVSMGGYNTACEVLDRGLPTLMVPRIWPRLEQHVRATRLARHGQVTALDPSQLDGAAVAAWVTRAAEARPQPRPHIDLDGLARVRHLAQVLLGTELIEDKEGIDVAV